MAFRNGSMSFARFRVTGGPDALRTEMLEQLSRGVLRTPSTGPASEVEVGWTTGVHLFDTEFTPDACVCGDWLCVAMRRDQHRVPAVVRKAYLEMALRAATAAADGDGPGGGASWGRGSRKAAREEAEDRCRREVSEGRHRSSKLVPVLWNVRTRDLLAPVNGDAVVSSLRDLMTTTFEARLEPLGSGALALEHLQRAGGGGARAFEDLRPTPFTPPPPQAEAASGAGEDPSRPLVPWALGGGEPRDFLGNELAIWLWWRLDAGAGAIETPGGDFELAIDGSLDMQCAWDATGRQALRGHAPHRLVEAGDALASGKWPRRVGLLLAAGEESASLVLQADRLAVSGLRLPKPEEPPASPGEALEDRINRVEAIDGALLALYRTFLDERVGGGWSRTRKEIVDWIRDTRGGTRRPRAATTATPAARPAVEIEVAPMGPASVESASAPGE